MDEKCVILLFYGRDSMEENVCFMDENVCFMDDNVEFMPTLWTRMSLLWKKNADLWMKIAAGQARAVDQPGPALRPGRRVGTCVGMCVEACVGPDRRETSGDPTYRIYGQNTSVYGQ
jgi:hypothetical protein